MSRYLRPSFFPVLAAVALAGTILAGCGEDDQPTAVERDPIIEPVTAGEMVARFLSVYENRDVENYLDLLDPDFLLILQSETTNEFPELGTSLDFGEEERIHLRLFSGEAVTDPAGEFQPAVRGISFTRFRILDAWSPTDDPENFPASEWAPYEVRIEFDRGQNFSALEVEGTVKIYARRYTENVSEQEVVHYLMAGMIDLTSSGAKGVDNPPWGTVRAYYR